MRDEDPKALEYKEEAASLTAKLKQAEEALGDRNSLIQKLTIQSNHFEKTAQELETELLLATEGRDAAENALSKERPLREQGEKDLDKTSKKFDEALIELEAKGKSLEEASKKVADLERKVAELEANQQKVADDSWMEGLLDGYADLGQRARDDHPTLDLNHYTVVTSQLLSQLPN